MKIDQTAFDCPVGATLALIGGKYKPLILWHLREGRLRYSELQRRIQQATPKMLAQQLRALEADGAVARTVYPTVPPRVEYALTAFGRTLLPVLEAMCEWGEQYLEGQGKCPRAACCQGRQAEAGIQPTP